MSLADHWDETGGDWLGVGDHEVYIATVRVGITPTDKKTPFAAFEVKSVSNGQKREATIYTSKDALWKLVKWVKACGLSKEDCAQYEPGDPSCHQGLINMRLMVRVEQVWKEKKGRSYPEVTDFWALNVDAPPVLAAKAAPATPPAHDDGQPEPEPPEGYAF